MASSDLRNFPFGLRKVKGWRHGEQLGVKWTSNCIGLPICAKYVISFQNDCFRWIGIQLNLNIFYGRWIVRIITWNWEFCYPCVLIWTYFIAWSFCKRIRHKFWKTRTPSPVFWLQLSTLTRYTGHLLITHSKRD